MALFAPHFTLSSNGLSVCILANGLSTNVTKAGFSRFRLSKTYQTSVRKRWSSISCPIIWLACSINCRICVCPGGRLLSIHQILVLCDIYRLHRCWIIDSYANVGHIKQVHAKANLPGPGCWMGILLWCTPKVSKKYWIDTKKIVFQLTTHVFYINKSILLFSAFFPLLVILHFVQLFFYHILISQDWYVATLFGNSLWLVALIYYVYINFLGYNSLGILQNTRAFLYPLAPIVVFIIGTLIANWNLSKSLMNFYHYRVLWRYNLFKVPTSFMKIVTNATSFNHKEFNTRPVDHFDTYCIRILAINST